MVASPPLLLLLDEPTAGADPQTRSALLAAVRARAAAGTAVLYTTHYLPELAELHATLALVPTHRDAILGRTVTLSHLGRYDEAIAAAARLIELGSWFTGEAYYWRAWDEYHLARIADARNRTTSSNNLKQIAIAFHNFASANGDALPGDVLDKDGKPLPWKKD